MRISAVLPGSIAHDVGILPGDELLEINGRRVGDSIDLRYHESDRAVSVKVARDGEVTIYDIEKDDGEPLGLELEEMKVLSCGNDCIFCFVDQNPKGLREALYFRDGDYRLSFLYGNYTTMTNAGPATLRRIVEQRLSPQYISVHVTDFEVRRALMGLKKDDRILEKIEYLHDNGIDMHTQIVLCPGINDGEVLQRTVRDLYRFRARILSLAVVPVGLTDHRFGLAHLRRIDQPYAERIVSTVEHWQQEFRREIDRGFIYPSDELYLVARRAIPPAKRYDGFWQVENGVGLVRQFLRDFQKQSRSFPERLARTKRITLATAVLPAGILQNSVVARLRRIGGLSVDLVVVPNTLFGPSVTVAGLLSGKCLYSALRGRDCGDLLLLPPDVLNADGLFLDDSTADDLSARLGAPVHVFDGRWADVFAHLTNPRRR